MVDWRGRLPHGSRDDWLFPRQPVVSAEPRMRQRREQEPRKTSSHRALRQRAESWLPRAHCTTMTIAARKVACQEASHIRPGSEFNTSFKWMIFMDHSFICSRIRLRSERSCLVSFPFSAKWTSRLRAAPENAAKEGFARIGDVFFACKTRFVKITIAVLGVNQCPFFCQPREQGADGIRLPFGFFIELVDDFTGSRELRALAIRTISN